jgi:hypothetical protein
VSTYSLTRDEVLEYSGFHGTRALCHLRVYETYRELPVCIVGNFDGGLGTSTTNAIETVATRVAEQIDSDEFRLIEWYPHGYYAQGFSEAILERVPATGRAHGQVLIQGEPPDHALATGHTAIARFAHPQWTHRSENELAELLGGETVQELRALASERGDYTVERLFGRSGLHQANAVRAHNRFQFDALEARLGEWSLER